jgi:DNA-binding transcriptional ArsR family regulator
MDNRLPVLTARFAALADPTRRAIVARLARGEAAVGALAAPTGKALPAVMKHLAVLQAAGLVVTEKRGRVRTCRLQAEALRGGPVPGWPTAWQSGTRGWTGWAGWPCRSRRAGMDGRRRERKGRCRMRSEPTGPNDLGPVRRPKARRSTLRRCWTEPALLEQWLCPRPWRATDVRVDLPPGGVFASIIRGPEGQVFDNDPGFFLDVQPKVRLVWTTALGPGYRPLITPPTGSP